VAASWKGGIRRIARHVPRGKIADSDPSPFTAFRNIRAKKATCAKRQDFRPGRFQTGGVQVFVTRIAPGAQAFRV